MKRVKKIIRKISLWFLIVLLILSLLISVITAVDEYKLSYTAFYSFTSLFSKNENDEVKAFKEKNGIIKGVCHPIYNKGQDLLDGNIEWVRIDYQSLIVSDENGFLEEFIEKRSLASNFHSCGLKVMCVYSSSIQDCVAEGADIRTEEGKKIIAEQSKLFIENVREYVDAIQICNEISMDRFTLPYTFNEAVQFACYLLECMHPYKGDILLGVNSLGMNCCALFEKMQSHLPYMDYVGTDLYLGCFDSMTKYIWMYDVVLRGLYAYTKKPVILCEFGYIGLGEGKTDEEKQAILQQYGYRSEEEAQADILHFIDQLPEKLKKNILYSTSYESEEELADLVFHSEIAEHLYRELPETYYVKGYPHTRQGQADCVYDIIQRLKKLPFVCGAFVYCYTPADSCYFCGQNDCPLETGWSLTNADGTFNPVYYSVQKAYKEWEK